MIVLSIAPLQLRALRIEKARRERRAGTADDGIALRSRRSSADTD
jgi:hypothetical protein